MYPAPGPMVQAPEAKNALAATIFEEHPPFTNNPGAAEFVKAFNERAAKAGFPYTGVETQAAASYSAWQVLEAAVTATKSLDDKVLAEWLRKNRVDTIQGKLRFDGPSNYGDDLMRVKQVQNGRWVVGLAEGECRAGRDADPAVAAARDGAARVPRCSRSRSSRGFSSARCTGCWGSGLSLSWGLLRQINLAHFALAFLGAYLCYQLSAVGGMDPLATLLVIVPGFFAHRRRAAVGVRAASASARSIRCW